MLIQLAVLAAALLLMTAGAEALVRGASGAAKRLGVSSFFIGLTIVGFGTSTPELCTSLIAASRGQADIAVGNVVGSNIFNIALILGITALICPIPVKVRLVRSEVLVVIGVALLPWLALARGGRLERWQGALMLVGLLVYVWRGYVAGRRENARGPAGAAEAELEEELGVARRAWLSHPAVSALLIALGLALLVAGSRLLVGSASAIARGLGVSELVIGLTIVAGGTSAPELMTSLVAAARKHSDISVGNILGSNIFNILGILGLTCVLTPQAVNPQVLWLDTPVMVAASVALLPIMMSRARISRAEGALLLLGYGAYTVALFTIAPAWFAA